MSDRMVRTGAGSHRDRLKRLLRSIRMGSRDSRRKRDELFRKARIFMLHDPFRGLHFGTEIPARIVHPGEWRFVSPIPA
jgi:hypothetical protein